MNTLKKTGVVLLMSTSIMACNHSKNAQPKETTSTPTEKPVAKTHKAYNVNELLESALNGEIETITEALDNDFDPNTIGENNRTIIMMAAFNGHTELVKVLIEKGADVNHTDNIKRTALMYASTGPFVPTVMALLNAGADPNMTDGEENWTAVMMAASEGQLEVLKALVANGADINMVDVDKESSLDFAHSKGHTAVADYIKSLK